MQVRTGMVWQEVLPRLHGPRAAASVIHRVHTARKSAHVSGLLIEAMLAAACVDNMLDEAIAREAENNDLSQISLDTWDSQLLPISKR